MCVCVIIIVYLPIGGRNYSLLFFHRSLVHLSYPFFHSAKDPRGGQEEGQFLLNVDLLPKNKELISHQVVALVALTPQRSAMSWNHKEARMVRSWSILFWDHWWRVNG